MLGQTPSQTIGPFFHDCLNASDHRVLARPDTEGQRIRVEGGIYDGDGASVTDALVEIWQANSRGRYRHPADDRDAPLDASFIGFGRAATDEEGRYWFETVKPGSVPWRDGQRRQAPHINVQVFARGLLHWVATRLYFPEEAANDSDPVLETVPAPRRGTLVAELVGEEDPVVYRFDITLQGEGETVFLDL